MKLKIWVLFIRVLEGKKVWACPAIPHAGFYGSNIYLCGLIGLCVRYFREEVHAKHAKAPRSLRREEKEQSLYKIFEKRNYLCVLSDLCVNLLNT
jgi:hypothetical protein